MEQQNSINNQPLDNEQQKRDRLTLLQPYKSIGTFIDNNKGFVYNAGKKLYYAVTTGHSFKVYSLPDMKIKLTGPHFENKLRGICGLNELLFIIQKNKILKMSYYHVLSEFISTSKIVSQLVLGSFLIYTNEKSQTIVIDHNSGIQTTQFSLNFQPNIILHPPTYLNKVLICGEKDAEIWNIATGKMIYSLMNSLSIILINNTVITSIECAPIIDVVAIALSSGKIVLHNIKIDQQLFSFQQYSKAISLSFSKIDFPLLATGDEQGNVNVWDLNSKKLHCSLKNAHKTAITDLTYLPLTEQILVSASGGENCILQWLYEESDANKFILLRQRRGIGNPIKKLRFMGDEGLHILACSSNSQEPELRDFSLLNECISTTFSLKDQSKKQMLKNFTMTEQNTASQVGEINDFSFSTNRERDWANIISIHKSNEKPCLWSSENHSIQKLNLELFDEEKQKSMMEGRILTAVFVTYCGNFAVLGIDDGRIIKVNMQSGRHQKTFQPPQIDNNQSIIDLYVDHYNKNMISADCNGNLIIRDFFSGRIWFTQMIAVQNQFQIQFIRGARFSTQILLALTDFSLEVWDTAIFKRGRKFIGHQQRILDAVFSFNNQHIISSALDCSIRIWDLLTNSMISHIETEKPVISLDVSPDGELLASCFANSKEINLWHNLLMTNPSSSQVPFKLKFQSKIEKTEKDERKRFYLHDQIKEEQVEDDEKSQQQMSQILNDKNDKRLLELKNEAQKNNTDLIKFTELEPGKWVPLIYLEEIKERNKVQITEELQINIPFFLDLDNKDEMKLKIEEEYKSQIAEKTKIIKNKRDQYLEELGSELDKIFLHFHIQNKNDNKSENVINNLEQKKEQSEKFINYLKTLTASQLDYEMRKFLFGNIQNIEKMLQAFNIIFDYTSEFDLKNTYFNRFLKVAGDDIIRNNNMLETLQEIQQKIKTNWSILSQKLDYITCLAEHFAKVPNY